MEDTLDYPISKVIKHFYPKWNPPKNSYRWNPTRCPFHDEERASASVSFQYNAFHCHACDASGGFIRIIMRERKIGYGEAIRYATGILGEEYDAVSRKPARKSRRKTFGESGSSDRNESGTAKPVPPWLR